VTRLGACICAIPAKPPEEHHPRCPEELASTRHTYFVGVDRPTRIEVPPELKGWLISHVVSSELGVDVYLVPEHAPRVAVVYGECDPAHPEETQEGAVAVIAECHPMHLRFHVPHPWAR
jgi:hypothetical protein